MTLHATSLRNRKGKCGVPVGMLNARRRRLCTTVGSLRDKTLELTVGNLPVRNETGHPRRMPTAQWRPEGAPGGRLGGTERIVQGIEVGQLRPP